MRTSEAMRRAIVLLAMTVAGCGGSTDAAGSTTTEDAAGRLSIPNQARPEADVVTGGQPTDADLNAAAEAGFALVVSLRTEEEADLGAERALVERLGMRFESLPVAGADDITTENAASLDSLLLSAGGPAIVHCASGNRVGALFALRAFAAGAGVDEALAVGRRAGLTGLEEVVADRVRALCLSEEGREC